MDTRVATATLTAETRALVMVRDMTPRELEAHALRMNRIMQAIRRINEHLLVAREEPELYQYACDTLLGVDNNIAVWIGEKRNDFTIRPLASAGFDIVHLQRLSLRWDPSGLPLAGRAIREGVAVMVDDAPADPQLEPWHEPLEKLGAASIACVPIKIDSRVLGVIELWSREPGAFDAETLGFLMEAAGDVAIGVRSLRQSKRLEATLQSLKETLDGTVEAIAAMVEYRDPYTAGHERRVSELAEAIGVELGFNEKRLEGLRVMGYIHDLGKIAVPAEILSKPSALSAIEMALIREHAEVGYQILKKLKFPWPVADAVHQHHERLDGSGYPKGLAGDAIILEARILAVADTVEAMASHRPYRPARGIDVALDEIRRGRGRIYDALVVDACLRLFADKGYAIRH